MVKELLDYFNGDELAASAWLSKYMDEGEITPDDMHRRMAKELARIERIYQTEESRMKMRSLSEYGSTRENLTEDKIFELFQHFSSIIPQGSIMSQLGVTSKIGSLSNCFVIGQPHDSYSGILHKDQQLVQLMKRRGGVGIDISTLRPAGTAVSNAAKTSTGATSFMHRFSNSTREVAQGGRRGALMLTIDVRHPDVLDFINIKKDRTAVTGANISVMLRDDFMKAVKNDEDYILRFPSNLADNWVELLEPESYKEAEYNKLYPAISNGETLGYTKRVKAKEIYDAIVENAWENAEPGQMFVDRHHEYSPDSVYPQFKGITTNPCGEIFMQAYDACRLLAMNFFSMVKNPFTDNAEIDLDRVYETAYEQQRLADNIVDLELEHISKILAKIHSDDIPDEVKAPEIELWEKVYDTAAASRRTGCGFTALGDMLAALNLAYDSELGMDMVDLVLKTKMRGELDCTIDLAITRGTFKGYNYNLEYDEHPAPGARTEFYGNNEFYQMLYKEFRPQFYRMKEHGRRNVSWSTVAPTGTVSLMAQTTSGLEPLFAPYYIRKKKGNPGDEGFREDSKDQNGDSWMHYPVIHPKFKDWVNQNHSLIKGIEARGNEGLTANDVSVDLTNEGHVKLLFANSPWKGSCAPDIDWMKRIEVQAIIQKYTSHSISSTINLPEEVTKEEVDKIYMHAFEQKLKGVTIYRDGSRTGVLVTSDDSNNDFAQHDAPKRPRSLDCEIYHTTVQGEKYTVVVGLLDDKPYEVFATTMEFGEHKGKGKTIKKAKGKYVIDVESSEHDITVTDFMKNGEAALARMTSTALRHGAKIDFIVEQLNKSGDGIVSFSKAIARTLKRYVSDEDLLNRAKCEDCGSTDLRMEEGCVRCNSCGSSKCG